MSKAKIGRKSTFVDMTAMCDVAFLLLTFFMLTTKFKPDEPVIVDTPSSISEIKLPETDIITLTIDKKGRIFFGIDGQPTRLLLLDKISKKYDITFDDNEKFTFALLSNFGVPVHNLKQLLNMTSDERSKLDQPGIPCDSVKNELGDWVLYARQANPKFRIAVKGDRNAQYPVVKEVITTLQNKRVHKFNFITTMEAAPEI